jgi:hypothetical protein
VISFQFNQKKGLTICAKGDTAQDQSGTGHILWGLLTGAV